MKLYERPEPPARVFLFTLGQRTIPMKLKPSILIAAITVILSSCSDLSHIDIVVESPNVVSANEEFVITNHIINYSQEIQEVSILAPTEETPPTQAEADVAKPVDPKPKPKAKGRPKGSVDAQPRVRNDPPLPSPQSSDSEPMTPPPPMPRLSRKQTMYDSWFS